jgi:hypothetical protein
MKLIVPLVMMAALVSADTSIAQDAGCYDSLMIPVIAERVPGAAGSLWQTHLAVTNHSHTPILVLGYGECMLGLCVNPPPIQPDSTIYPKQYTPYLEVECGRVRDLAIQFRVQDLSRQSETWGTTVPVVRESELFQGVRLNLIDIPNTADFRSLLRVYGFDKGVEGAVTIRFFAVDAGVHERGNGDDLLLELHRQLAVDPRAPTWGPPLLQVPLWTLPELQDHTRIRVEVEGESHLRLWAFVSATNNSTQHVTVIAP